MICPRRLSAFIKPLMKGSACLGVWIVVSLSDGMQAQAADTAILEKGEILVRAHCTRCHVVGNLNKYGGIDSTPSFGVIKSLPDWQDRFAAFWSLLPHPSVVQVDGLSLERPKGLPATTKQIFLDIDDVDGIQAYVKTLPVKDLGGGISYRQQSDETNVR